MCCRLLRISPQPEAAGEADNYTGGRPAGKARPLSTGFKRRRHFLCLGAKVRPGFVRDTRSAFASLSLCFVNALRVVALVLDEGRGESDTNAHLHRVQVRPRGCKSTGF